MNKVILMGRLTRDPDVRYTAGDNSTAIARYTLAVDRRFARREDNGNGQSADFIGCVAFGKSAEFTGKYLHQGIKIVITGRIQTGSYISRDGNKVYTTDVIVEDQEFAESKTADSSSRSGNPKQKNGCDEAHVGESGFMNIPEDLDVELPFN